MSALQSSRYARVRRVGCGAWATPATGGSASVEDRDRGLRVDEHDNGLRSAIGPLGLGAAVLNTVVGAGIFVLPAALAREVGARAPLAYLACTVVMGCVALCFAAAGSRTPTSGGPLGYAEAAFGKLAGLIVGVLIWVAAALAAGGISAAVADAAGAAWPALAAPGPRAAVILALLGALAATNMAGAAPGTRLVGVLTVLKLVPLFALLAAGLVAGRAAAAPLGAGVTDAGRLGRAMLLALFAFQGMETALGVSGEVRDPARNVPRGLLGAMGAVAALYVALQLTAQHLLGAALPGAKTPLVAAARVAWAPLGPVLLVGTAVSMLGYLASDALSAPRTLMAFGREGVLPAVFGRVSARTGAPTAAILAHVGVAATLALTGGFVELATLASLASVGTYLIGCAAAVVLQRRGVARAGAPLRVPGLELAAAVAGAAMLWLLLNARPGEVVGLLAVLAVSVALYFTRVRPRARRA